MKKIVKYTVFFLLIGCAMVSCKRMPLVDIPVEENEGNCSMSIVLEGAVEATQATGVTYDYESTVNRWAYWVFDSSNFAVKAGVGSGTSALVGNLQPGSYRVMVIANYPTSGTYRLAVTAGCTLSELQSRIVSISDNGLTNLVFSGISPVTNVVAESTVSTSITITRLVSKVGIKKISVNYTDPALAAKTTTLKAIYLINNYRYNQYGSDIPYGSLSATRSDWYNPMWWHFSGDPVDAAGDALLGDTAINTILTPGAPHMTQHWFYTMPNPTPVASDNTSDDWGVRSTRLVIETDLGGKTYYYGIRLPDMTRNRQYVCGELTITGRGSILPYRFEAGSVDVHFSVNVAEWDTPVIVVNETL